MHLLSSLMHCLTLRGAHNQQKRIALHLLAASGVVRPSHLELRYATPNAGTSALRTQPTVSENAQTHPIPLQSWDHNITLNMKQTRQWARRLSSFLVQLAKKPIVLQWSKQFDV